MGAREVLVQIQPAYHWKFLICFLWIAATDYPVPLAQRQKEGLGLLNFQL